MKNFIGLALAAAMVIGAPAAWAKGGGGHSSGGHAAASHSSKSSGAGDHYVSGYTRKDGTVVSGYHATDSNGTKNDNYSTRGNVNPGYAPPLVTTSLWHTPHASTLIRT